MDKCPRWILVACAQECNNEAIETTGKDSTFKENSTSTSLGSNKVAQQISGILFLEYCILLRYHMLTSSKVAISTRSELVPVACSHLQHSARMLNLPQRVAPGNQQIKCPDTKRLGRRGKLLALDTSAACAGTRFAETVRQEHGGWGGGGPWSEV